jgi:hypothetical protein
LRYLRQEAMTNTLGNLADKNDTQIGRNSSKKRPKNALWSWAFFVQKTPIGPGLFLSQKRPVVLDKKRPVGWTKTTRAKWKILNIISNRSLEYKIEKKRRMPSFNG